MKQIGTYTVDDEPIGIGGMGKILRGHDTQGNVVAIKEISPEFSTDLQIRYHIEKEVKILFELDHPNIVKIYTSFIDEKTNNFYIVMELVDGMNLEQYVKQNGQMPEEEAIKKMLEILNAMHHVHDHGIIHRDIKPSNIMIRDTGEVCILDFGVAKDTTAKSGTIMGSIIGTDGYMSPEQADGYDIDKRADIYALGCVLFYMLTGHHAFNTLESEFETKNAIINKEFPRLSKYRKGLRPLIQTVVDKATDKNMMKRYQSCVEFAAGLRKVLQGTFTNEHPEGQEPIKITIGREKCDILVCDEDQKVSRHHAEVEYKCFTGGSYYFFTDCSANGTLIGNKTIHRESVKIPANGPAPEIFLACVEGGRLNWKDVVSLLKERVEESQNVAAGTPSQGINTSAGIKQPTPNNKKWLILGIIAGVIILILLTVVITLAIMVSTK